MSGSIKKQFAFLFGSVMAGSLILCMVISSLFSSSYYIKNKERVLAEGYNYIENMAGSGSLESGGYDTGFDYLSGKNNLEILVLDTDTETIRSTSGDNRMARRLLDYIINGNSSAELISQQDKYIIQKAVDPSMGMQYLELWGFLSDGKMILMRTPIESIKDSAAIANKFLTYIGIVALIIGIIITWIISSQVTKPILELVDISAKMTNLDFDAKYTSGGRNEIAMLGEHINDLSKKLESTISELKTANNELKQDLARKTELEEMRTEFLSNVSHELKTPIALIQGYAEGLKDNVNSDEESRDFYCDVIVDEADRMNRLVKSLLELNELENRFDNIKLERFDVVMLIKNCINTDALLLEQKEIRLKFEQNEPIYVWADQFKVEQIVNNYLSNAIHYVKNEMIIEIKTEIIDDKAHIDIFNTGDRIPDESLDKLWQKFYKVDKARTREYGGSGIGLSIVKAIMDSMGQNYGVINRVNGVSFWFELDAKGEVV
ncbi:MAG: HAMP domain-containing histidine kinase [Lachnospiraceae bacterium]|nr:HAMP domain-containing histidine kinase [Lachnospiraceae bacterium]